MFVGVRGDGDQQGKRRGAAIASHAQNRTAYLQNVVRIQLVDPVQHVVEVGRPRLGRQHELDARAALEALQLEVVALQLLDARGGQRRHLGGCFFGGVVMM